MKSFDLISDTHIDFWVKLDHNPQKLKMKMKKFILDIIPNKPSRILIITGDIGHYNAQNILFLSMLKEFYEIIVLVSGNHDLYLISKTMQRKYGVSSMKRVEEMKSFCQSTEGIYLLDGEILSFGDFKIGGTMGWYDFSFGLKEGFTYENILYHWKECSNDYSYIKGLFVRPTELFEKEQEKIEKIMNADIVLTHIPPEYSHMTIEENEKITTSFYCFDGDKYYENFSGIWCFGHTHYKCDFQHQKTRFLSHALGYPQHSHDIPCKIKTVFI